MNDRTLDLEGLALQYAMQMQTGDEKPSSRLMFKARMLLRLICEMKQGVVEFRHIDRDGIVQRTCGSLQQYEHDFRTPYTINPENQFIVYYDHQVGGWRAVKAENVLEIIY